MENIDNIQIICYQEDGVEKILYKQVILDNIGYIKIILRKSKKNSYGLIYECGDKTIAAFWFIPDFIDIRESSHYCSWFYGKLALPNELIHKIMKIINSKKLEF